MTVLHMYITCTMQSRVYLLYIARGAKMKFWCHAIFDALTDKLLTVMAPQVVLKRIAACIVFVAISCLSVTADRCFDKPVVYDIAFEFNHKCSMTVFWEGPFACPSVAGYIVQSAQGCPSSWTNSRLIKNSTTSYTIEDIDLITSCLLGNCYIRIIADFEHSDFFSEPVYSVCYGVGDAYYESYTSSIGM